MNRQQQSNISVSTRLPHQHLSQEADGKSTVLKQAVLSSLKQWWKVTFPIGLVLAAGAAAGLYYTFIPQFKARATVEIADSQPHILTPGVLGRTSERFVKTQQELLRSALVLGPVVSRADIAKLPEITEMEDPIRQLGENISFKSRNGSNLYDISYSSSNSKNAATIVNAIVDAYFNLYDEHAALEVNETIQKLEEERDAHAKKVTRLRASVREMTKDNPEMGQQLPKSATGVASPLNILRSRLTDLEVELAVLRANLSATEKIDQANPVIVKNEEVQYALENHGQVQALRLRIANKQQRLREMKEILVAAEKDPDYKNLLVEIKNDEELLAKTRVDLQKEIRETLIDLYKRKRAGDIEQKRTNLNSNTVLHDILQKQLEEELARTTNINVDNLELEFKRDEMARAETVYSLIAQRIEKIQAEQRAPRQIIPRMLATPPKVPVEKYPLKKMALAGMAAFCVPLLLAFGWEWRMQRLSNSEQLSTFSNVPVVGEIASFPARARSNSNVLSRRVSRALRHFEESVHSLRTYLVLSEPLAGMKVLAVTSSISQEGKTSVATQLALSFARANERVILIDGDMRSPDIHTIFDVERGPGLAEVLEGKATLEEAIQRDSVDEIYILPAGRLSAEPHQLVSNGAIGKLLDKLREEYATIIVDTPPVLAASEALVMASAADATLLCAMRDKSRLTQVKATQKRLVDAGAHPVGAVFSNVPVSRYYNSYGDYDYSPED